MRTISVMLLLVFASLSAAGDLDTDNYLDTGLKFGIQKPQGWYYVSRSVAADLTKKAQVGEEYAAELKRYKGPVLTFQRATPYGVPVTVKVSTGYEQSEDVDSYLSMTASDVLHGLRNMLDNVSVITKPHYIEHNGLRGMQMAISGEATYPGNGVMRFTGMSWFFLKNHREYQLTIVGPADGYDSLKDEYLKIYESFVLL